MEEKMKHQQLEANRRENILVMRLTTKEQEMQEYLSQIQELKQTQVPTNGQLQSTLIDPAINLMFESMKKEVDTSRAKVEEMQNELNAWKFTPDSTTGKRLMAKCRLLYQENEELGKMIASGRIAKLEGELALQKNFSEELKKSQSEIDEFLLELDEDVEGMQNTIYYLQQQLKESKEKLAKYEANDRQQCVQQNANNSTNSLSNSNNSLNTLDTNSNSISKAFERTLESSRSSSSSDSCPKVGEEGVDTNNGSEQPTDPVLNDNHNMNSAVEVEVDNSVNSSTEVEFDSEKRSESVGNSEQTVDSIVSKPNHNYLSKTVQKTTNNLNNDLIINKRTSCAAEPTDDQLVIDVDEYRPAVKLAKLNNSSDNSSIISTSCSVATDGEEVVDEDIDCRNVSKHLSNNDLISNSSESLTNPNTNVCQLMTNCIEINGQSNQ